MQLDLSGQLTSVALTRTPLRRGLYGLLTWADPCGQRSDPGAKDTEASAVWSRLRTKRRQARLCFQALFGVGRRQVGLLALQIRQSALQIGRL